jgi:hypothetical protein
MCRFHVHACDEMKSINRFALIVRPASPYIEWAAKAFGEPESKVRREINELEASIYLLNESSAPDADHPALLKGQWKTIFDEELESWCTEEDLWPKHRTEALFRAWFKLELCTLVFDCGSGSIEHETL